MRTPEVSARQLRNFMALKEKNPELLVLEGRRGKTAERLAQVEDAIRTYLQKRPAARPLIRAVRSASMDTRRRTRVSRPKGWLREHVTALLKRRTNPMTPAEIRNAIAEKYPEQATKHLYISIFQFLRRNDEFKKNKDGWSLKKTRKKRNRRSA